MDDDPRSLLGEPTRQRNQFRATEYLVNFGDGPVAGHVHSNPDGSPGGLVADTAHVEPTVWMSSKAKVFGNARVFGESILDGNVRIHGNATVDRSIITGDAEVLGNAKVEASSVGEHARVSEGAR